MDIETILTKAVAEVIVKESLRKRLNSKKKLRVKFGIDPTAPDVHIGHAVPIRKLAEFQRAGHQAVLIIGDYTAMIGDPSGRDDTRPSLDRKQVESNAKTYLEQIGKIIDVKKTEVRRNSEWFDKLELAELIKLLSRNTLAQLMAHRTFRARVEENPEGLHLHEILYPVFQGYDSVMVKADVELGGLDQKFNLLMGREIQRDYAKQPQEVVMMKYLLGTDGKEKMSKSLGNYIAINDPAETMYGKVMSIPDKLITEYAELATTMDEAELTKLEEGLKKGANPRDVKASVARRIVEELHGAAESERAEQEFQKVFKKGELPSNIPVISLKPNPVKAFELLVAAGLTESNSEAKRLIKSGGASINNKRIKEPDESILPKQGDVVRVGKRRTARIEMT